MTDAEISRRLALAIGWEESEVLPWDENSVWCCRSSQIVGVFDYRDPAVIWPIAERFNAFPIKATNGEYWLAKSYEFAGSIWFTADTAAKAVALSVIAAKEKA